MKPNRLKKRGMQLKTNTCSIPGFPASSIRAAVTTVTTTRDGVVAQIFVQLQVCFREHQLLLGVVVDDPLHRRDGRRAARIAHRQ
jgi:hypothetical protein